MRNKKFQNIRIKEKFYFQGDELTKCHLHYITNGHHDFPVNAVYLNGVRLLGWFGYISYKRTLRDYYV